MVNLHRKEEGSGLIVALVHQLCLEICLNRYTEVGWRLFSVLSSSWCGGGVVVRVCKILLCVCWLMNGCLCSSARVWLNMHLTG